jgi:hypothetical protein
MTSLEINNKIFYPENTAEIKLLVDSNGNRGHAEVIIRKENGESLVVLLNTKSAFINLFGSDNKTFHSLNFTGDKKKFEDFFLSNGTHEEYPENYLVTRNEGVEALSMFYAEGKIPAEIALEED